VGPQAPAAAVAGVVVAAAGGEHNSAAANSVNCDFVKFLELESVED
jgi:hypothetical protein